MKKSLNEGLRQRQEQQRIETANVVKTAIQDLHSEGFTIISNSMLVERTGLGRSTFNKPHVLKVLKEYGVGRFKSKTIIDSKREEIKIEQLEKENEKYQKEIKKLTNQLNKKDQRINKLENQLEEKNKEILEVRGEIMRVFRKANLMGIDLS